MRVLFQDLTCSRTSIGLGRNCSIGNTTGSSARSSNWGDLGGENLIV